MVETQTDSGFVIEAGEETMVILAAMLEKDPSILTPLLAKLSLNKRTAYFNYHNIVQFLVNKGVIPINTAESTVTEQVI